MTNGCLSSTLLGPCGLAFPKKSHDLMIAGKSKIILAISAKKPPLGVIDIAENPEPLQRDCKPKDVNLKKS